MTDRPDRQPRSRSHSAPHAAAGGGCWRGRCGARAGRFSGNGCGRRWRRSRRRSACSSPRPGSASGCGCRRSGGPSVSVVFVLSRSRPCVPFLLLRLPSRDGRPAPARSPLRPAASPATAIADEIAYTDEDPFSVALWNAHVRARAYGGRVRSSPACRRRALRVARSLRGARPGRCPGDGDVLCRRRGALEAHRRGVRLAGRRCCRPISASTPG